MLQVFPVQRLDFGSLSGFFDNGGVGVSAGKRFTEARHRKSGVVVNEHRAVFCLVACNDFNTDEFGMSLVEVLENGVALLGGKAENPN